MSRAPVHEAIIRLQAEGLVQVLLRRGVLICPISAEDI
jgi:DNA-binding GntR family transcriptional regulator